MGQTVNLLSLTSVVRIHLPPPIERRPVSAFDFFAMQKHRSTRNVPFPRPCGTTGNDAQKLHASAFAYFGGTISRMKSYTHTQFHMAVKASMSSPPATPPEATASAPASGLLCDSLFPPPFPRLS